MYFTARINSFITDKEIRVADVLEKFSLIDGLTHVDLNYPEHFEGMTVDEMKRLLEKNGLKAHGLAMRYRAPFLYGAFSNKDSKVVEHALQLTYEAIDACQALEGENVTVWLGYDGVEYSFQADYVRLFDEIVDSFQKVCAYAKSKNVKVSIEYKPYEPRAYSMIDSAGMAMYIIEKVGADNLGLTLDYCHMLMKKELPAYGLSLALRSGRLHALHLNDGYGRNDDGMMIGSGSLMSIVECIYYLKKYGYDGMVYFDTFPVREDAAAECAQNIRMFRLFNERIDKYGVDKISEVVAKNDAVAAMEMFMDLL